MFCFFLNDTATTEIYTYGHTLSLHDALPICGQRGKAVPADAGRARAAALRHRRRRAARAGRLLRRDAEPGERAGAARSEEHTSELQSLMRISYAVFCLKKQK